MERDEETGLSYHGTRYLASWLGRWISCDPKGLIDGVNLLSYVNNRPLSLIDHSGTSGRSKQYRNDFVRRRTDVPGVRSRPGAQAGEEAWKTPKREKGWYRNEQRRTGTTSPGRWRLPNSGRKSGNMPDTQVGHPLGKPHHSHGNTGGPGRPETPQDNLNKYQIEQGRPTAEKVLPLPEPVRPPTVPEVIPATPPATPPAPPAATPPIEPVPVVAAKPVAIIPTKPTAPVEPGAPKIETAGPSGSLRGVNGALLVAGVVVTALDLYEAKNPAEREQILKNTAEGVVAFYAVSNIPYVGPPAVALTAAAGTGYAVGEKSAKYLIPEKVNIGIGKAIMEGAVGAKPEDLSLLDNVDIKDAAAQGIGEAVYKDAFGATPDDVELLENMEIPWINWKPFHP